ncbi:MAG: WG repeat-containing protein [Flavobacterium sp.]
MKQFILLLILLISNCLAFAQNKDTWTSFWDKDTTHLGFKDKTGKIKIPPKFTGITSANKFDDIIVVSEDVNDKWKSYYLTKTGKIVGLDSLYIFDNGPDCENEGFIRFTDRKTDKMGFFNQEGKIIIPAEYSDLTKMRNGMFIALKDAEKETDGEHFFWKGGKEFLIDSNNKILVENFPYTTDLNFYSVEKSKDKNNDPARDSFIGVNREYYSFINYDKEFKIWLARQLSQELSKKKLLKISADKITHWKEPKGWINSPKKTFINNNYKLLKNKLDELKSSTCEYFVSSDGLNQFIFESEEYQQYFDNCNQPKEWLYPVKNIVISPKNKADFGQDYFEFLRTENGYKLISVSLKKKALNN